uniref:hypothetical protein n=1 Tax=Prevotella heparinolytica TaxID=28113 RepID=UPI0035A1D312
CSGKYYPFIERVYGFILKMSIRTVRTSVRTVRTFVRSARIFVRALRTEFHPRSKQLYSIPLTSLFHDFQEFSV